MMHFIKLDMFASYKPIALQLKYRDHHFLSQIPWMPYFFEDVMEINQFIHIYIIFLSIWIVLCYL